jgi:hypothetical protein
VTISLPARAQPLPSVEPGAKAQVGDETLPATALRVVARVDTAGNASSRESGDHCGPPVPSTHSAEAFVRAQCLFEHEDYEACLSALENACIHGNSARCHFNFAAVHHALLHCERAQEYYRDYLDADPYDEGHEQAVEALDELNAVCGDVQQRPSMVAPTKSASSSEQSEPTRRPSPAGRELAAHSPPSALRAPVPIDGQRHASSPRPWREAAALSLLGAGGATTVATVLAALSGRRANDDIESLQNRSGGQLDTRSAEAVALDRNGRTYNSLAWVLGVSSAVLLSAGGSLMLWETLEDSVFVVASPPQVEVGVRF